MIIQAYSRSYILSYAYGRIFAHMQAYFSRFRHNQDHGITCSNIVNQHLLSKSGFSPNQVTVQIYLEHFFIFVSKVEIQHFSLQDSISVLTITIITTCQPRYHATYACQPPYHATYASHASTPLIQTRHPPYPRYTR